MGKKSVLEGRLAGLDILRAVAFFFIPLVHFFMNSGFYSREITTPEVIPLLAIRWISYAGGVPVFIMLTGYLKRKKTVSWSHYRTIIPILVSYLIIATITMFYSKYVMKVQATTYIWIRSIFSFDSPSYAWYVGMYCGLFLLIPFLNNAYNGLKTKKEKRIFIITMLFLTAIPASINRMVIIQEKPLSLISPYWKSLLWHLTYYFIGMYIADFKPKMDKLMNVILILVCGAYQAVRTYLTGYGQNFYKAVNAEYNDAITYIVATLVFLLFYDINTEKKSVKAVAYIFSKHSLSAYLISFMVDNKIYKWLNKPEYIKGEHGYIKFIFPCAIMVALISTLLAYIVEVPSGLISKGITSVLDKAVNNKKDKQEETLQKVDTTDDYDDNADTEITEENGIFSDSQINKLLEGGSLDDEIDRFKRDKVNI